MAINKPNSTTIILILLGILFFVVYSFLTITTTLPSAEKYDYQFIFGWPDEMANHFFISQFIETNHFSLAVPENIELQNVIHPRSVNIFNSNLVPMGFLGMLILYGIIGKLIGASAVLFLTPLLAVFAVFFFYGIIKIVFNRKIAFISAVLLFTLATYCYYANMAMLSNILFIFLLLAGIYFILKSADNRSKLVYTGIGALLISSSLIVRTSEIMFVAPLIIIPFIAYYREINWRQIIIFLSVLLFPILLLCYFNNDLYGNCFSLGYLKMNGAENIIDRLPGEFSVDSGSSLISYFKLAIIPFGFHPRLIFFNLNKYFFHLLWPYFFLFLGGLSVWFFNFYKKNYSKKESIFILSFFASCFFLCISYGSWQFLDPIVLKYNTIGSSYARYWIPLNIFMLPVIAYLFFHILEMKKFKIFKYIVIVFFTIALSAFSLVLAFYSPQDGLVDQREIISGNYDKAASVDRMIEKNAIVITDRADKLFFPRRRTVVFNSDDSIFPKLKKAIETEQIYYFTTMSDAEIERLNGEVLSRSDLVLNDPVAVDGVFRLLKLSIK
ncbi:hypothetical protein KKC32_01430 [Patescibacteria group bacterium]|nr:hypothetical protein [Patescibacteria group bacterium]